MDSGQYDYLIHQNLLRNYLIFDYMGHNTEKSQLKK